MKTQEGNFTNYRLGIKTADGRGLAYSLCFSRHDMQNRWYVARQLREVRWIMKQAAQRIDHMERLKRGYNF